MYSLLTFISRLFISLIFIASGIRKIMTFDATIKFMEKFGMDNAKAFLIIAIIIEIICGLSILLGIKSRFSSLILFIFLAIVTCIFHLNFSDPHQIQEFLKNLAILGALLLLILHGSGPWSLSSRDF